MEQVVATEEELDDEGRIVVQVKGIEIGIFKIDDEYYGVPNWCPHQNGPLCSGQMTGRTEATFDRDTLTLDVHWRDEGEVVSCPWHGWQYNVTTGECISRKGSSLPTYDVRAENGEIIVSF